MREKKLRASPFEKVLFPSIHECLTSKVPLMHEQFVLTDRVISCTGFNILGDENTALEQ